MRRPRIVFASYALPGHINPCIVLAAELAERGHSVFFATQEEGRRWLAHPGVRYVAWEPRGADGGSFVERLRAVRGAVSEKRNGFHRMALSMDAGAEVYAAAFNSLRAALQPVAPDLLIVPQFLGPGMDLAHDMKWPLIIQSVFLPNSVRLRSIVATPDVRPRANWQGLVASIPWFLMRERASRRLQRARRGCSQCVSLDDLFRQTTIVAMSDTSIEAGEAFTPNVHLVGPLMPGTLPALPAPTRQWIDRHASAGIVLVSFGSLVKLRNRQLESLARGLVDCGAGVLWALPERQHALVLRYSPSFRTETFVPQTTILSRAPVRAFVSHAGANSAVEAMYWGRPVLGLPFMFDQHYYARRMADLSVGLQLEPHALTSEHVQGAIRRLLREPAFANAAQALAARLQRTPGVKGAADVVETELARPATYQPPMNG